MINKRKCFSFCFFLLFSASVFANVSIEVYCFTTGGEKPINMEMRVYHDMGANWTAGFVKYQNSKKPIPIFLKNSVVEVLSEDAPYQHTDSWIEIVNGKISGIYEIIIQGTQIPSFTYESYLSKKKFSFLLDGNTEGTPESGCLWQRP